MPFVYRVESYRGVGMYREDRCTDVSWAMQPNAWDDKARERNPSPKNDEKLQLSLQAQNLHMTKSKYGDPVWATKNYIFGFATKKQLTRWIYKKEWLIELCQVGMLVNKYKVEKDFYFPGSTQVIYDKKHATLVKIFRPSDFLAKSKA